MKTILMMITLFLLASVAEGKGLDKGIKPGKIVTKTLNLKNFKGIEANTAFKVELTNGPTTSVIIEAPENYIPYYTLRVEDEVLMIHLHAEDLELEGELGTIKITLSELNYVKLSGACQLQGKGSFLTKKLSLELSGASKLVLNVETASIDCNISGASAMVLSGETSGVMKMDISGASFFSGYNLQATSISCDISGVSMAELNASNNLTIDASGMSNVRYKGEVTHVNVESSGLSKVSHKG